MERRILLVEDHALFRGAFAQAMGRALAAEGTDVAFVEAGTMAEARARLREGGLDAALIDVVLPDGDGLDLVREINGGGSADGSIPTLVLTGSPDHKAAARAMDLGARGALTTVVSMPETVEAIKRLLDSGRTEA